MDRRTFLSGAAVVSASVALAACGEGEDQENQQTAETGTPDNPAEAPAVSRGMREWRLVTTWPKNFPGLGTGAQRLADHITTASEGRLTVKLYAAGELVPPFENFDAVREGKAQMSHAAAYYWINKHRSTPFYAAVPGGLVAQEHNAWVYHGGGQELWDELYAEFGLKAFLAGNSGTQMGGWFQKEINSIEDFQGLKMRIPGLGAEVINRLGATAVNLPGGEIMPALQSGVIDATKWGGPWNDLAFGFYKITKNYSGPG
ncbi:MAG: TRAP transporter substrate-binding protein, partial [Rhodospirillales bacterium]|nr:TRAP transporter substrate-binding protein [Rhodospirillales bacterium]